MRSAWQLIDLTRPLDPTAYVLHLDGAHVRAAETPSQKLSQWQDEEVQALELVAKWTGDPALLAVENLESYPPDFVMPVVERTGASRCVDVGHLWLDGHDPVPYLRRALPKTRSVHLHGLLDWDKGRRDHLSLAHMSPTQLDPVIDLFLCAPFTGVLTLEIFGKEDFDSSLAMLFASIERCR